MDSEIPKRIRPGESLADVQQRLVRAAELMSAKPQREVVKRHAAAAMLGVSIRTLQRWHKRKVRPAQVDRETLLLSQIGHRRVAG
jgi:DNA-binding transcriptional regulator YiaG